MHSRFPSRFPCRFPQDFPHLCRLDIPLEFPLDFFPYGSLQSIQETRNCHTSFSDDLMLKWPPPGSRDKHHRALHMPFRATEEIRNCPISFPGDLTLRWPPPREPRRTSWNPAWISRWKFPCGPKTNIIEHHRALHGYHKGRFFLAPGGQFSLRLLLQTTPKTLDTRRAGLMIPAFGFRLQILACYARAFIFHDH